MRLWLQKFVSPVNPQPFVRVEYRNLKKIMTTKNAEHKFKK
jgi:hydroxyacyl-ACP dehydratase HTD2-like protein with hotdog domain